MKFLNLLAAIVLTTLLLSHTSLAQNWPHWRGPNQNGISPTTDLPEKWSQSENIAWRVELPGPGPSTPITWGDRIFLTSADGDNLVLLSFKKSGQQLWKKIIGTGNQEFMQGESNLASASPVTDGKHVWAFFGTGDLVCVDFAGKEIWKVNLQQRYTEFSIYFGMAASPLLDGERLFMPLIHASQHAVIALDKNTGKEIWKSDRPSDARGEARQSYASPVIYRFNGSEFLLAHGADYITAHNLGNGKEIWRCGGLQNPSSYTETFRFVATPCVSSGLIVVPSAKNGAILGINPDGASGLITGNKKHVAWRRDRNTTDVPSPVIHDGLVYVCRENGQFLCLDAGTGEEIYYERAHDGRHRSSPVLADGKLYLCSMDGTVTIVKAGRQFEIVAKNQIDERTSASLAISDGVIYQRTYKALYAISR